MAADFSPRSGTSDSSSSLASTSKLGTKRTIVAWPHVVLGIMGIAAGSYAVYVHKLVEAGKETGCGISQTISCDAVIGSGYGTFFGLPLGVYGILFWAIVLVTAISTSTVSARVAALQRLAVGAVGLLTSLVLAYISLGVLHKLCLVCATTHTLSGINFLVALWGVWKLRGAKTTSKDATSISAS